MNKLNKKDRPDRPVSKRRQTDLTTTCPQMILSASCVRGGDGKRVRGDRWRWPFSHGIRACSRACVWMVEMSFSYLL